MRLNGKDRIITEDDIILSGSSLSERFESQQTEINKLKSNVKWIYKYGGVGKGGSGGGGSTTPFSIYATLNDIQLKDQTIVLNNAGSYRLYIKINNPNNSSFNVQYKYTTISNSNTITQTNTQILSIDNNYTIDTIINLNNNDTLTITATDGNDTKQVSCSYITAPYIFDFNLYNDKGTLQQEEVFIETASENGLNLYLNYTVSVNATISYEYSFQDQTITGDITDKLGTIKFPIDKSLFQKDNAGYYNAKIKLTVIPENQESLTIEYSKQFSLIPQNLYLLLLPEYGNIYKQETDSPNLYTPGYINFNYRVYEGVNNGRIYTVKASLNNTEILNTSITERQLNNFKIFANNSGLNILSIEVQGTTIYRATYYFYVSENTINLEWLSDNWAAYYYRISETSEEFKNYKNSICIEQNVNNDIKTFEGITTPNISGTSIINTHVAIGLQYSEINNIENTILEFYNDNVTNSIMSISQNKFSKHGTEKDIFIQKQSDFSKDKIEQYHLLQIYSQYVKTIGNDIYYQTSFYIDGNLEAEMPQLVNQPLLINKINILPTNCYINCIDIDYKEATQNNNCDYEVYQYYLKYRNEILKDSTINNEIVLLQYLNNFHIKTNGRVEVDYSTINSVSKNITTPSMLLVYENDSDEDFMEKLERNYGEDGSGIGSDLNFPVTVQWSPGNNGLNTIQFPSEYSFAQFRVRLQGSSTKLYRGKNFFMEVENTNDSDQAETYLFSPNFSNSDNTTFLPEKGFNLKADIVDSSHSNNTTCGKFVNTVCKKFISDNTNPYSSYVRNCLEGYPILLYLNVIDTDKSTGEKSSKYYYLGIYNLNLGRESYFNLGYRDLSVFVNGKQKLLNDAGNSFTFYKIEKDQDSNIKGLGVAEIQGGSPYFDFSQYDSSVLFEQSTGGSEAKDNTYMYGDLVRGNGSTEADLQKALIKLTKSVALSGGYLFDYLKKNKGSYEDGYNAEKIVNGAKTGDSLNCVPDYSTQYKRIIEAGKGSIYKPISQDKIVGTFQDLLELLIPDIDSGRKAILDYRSLAEYYTICMVLGLIDSVMKNLNLKTWDLTTWYLAFYDMDTCLGLNNAGGDISYFAFSDYWKGTSTEQNDIVYPEAIHIYRDFSPASLGDAGFDVPSSYLFAVAKYARLILRSEDYNTQMSIYPQELYAKWRSNTENLETNEGILKNADVFMDRFFSNNLGSISSILVSYNYRAKYLSLGNNDNSIQWVTIDYEKFHGTRINKVRDWLNGRLHILDAYFNLNNGINNIFEYLENDTWKTLNIGNTPLYDLKPLSNYSLSTNPDIIILHDIFSEDNSSTGVQVAAEVDFDIKCPEYSPLQIYNANSSINKSYILGGEKAQHISFKTTGNQNIKLGGSQIWTELSSINWISSGSNAILINSKNIETLFGNLGSFNGLTLRTPSIKTISLNSANYTGNLILSETSSYPNLNSIDISKSKIQLTASNLNISSLNISNINNPYGSIKISGCYALNNFTYNNITLNSLTFSQIPLGIGSLSFNNNNIGTLSLSCDTEGKSITITNDQTLQYLSLSGFKTINISNCNNLKKITIGQSDYSTINISISNCNNSELKIISSSREDAADFSGVKGLEMLKVCNCGGIKNLLLPDNITLPIQGCANLTNLKTVTGKNIKLGGAQVFLNCYNYTLKTESGTYTDLHSVTSNLDGTFSMDRKTTTLKLEDAKYFFNNCVDFNVTTINSIFYNNAGIVYNKDLFVQDLSTGSKNYIDLSKLTKLVSANYAFAATKINCFNKNMLNFGSSDGISLNAFIDSYSENNEEYKQYATLDSLDNIITKVTNLFGTYYNNRHPFIFLDSKGNQLSDTIKLADFFNPNGKSPSKLTTLSRFYVHKDQLIDLTGVFTSKWTSLTSLQEFLSYGQYSYIGVTKLLYNLPKLTSIGSILHDNLSGERIDLFTFLNWKDFLNRGGSIASGGRTYSNFYCNKYITLEDYYTLCNLLIKSNISSIAHIFQNCNIIGDTEELTFGTIDQANNTITDLSKAFYNCKLYKTKDSEEDSFIPLSKTFFKNLKQISNVNYLFRNTKLANGIPYDFFNKRYSITKSVFVRIGEEYKEATLTTYDYKHHIVDFTGLFQYTQWKVTQFNPTDSLPKNKVEYDGQTYDTYYEKSYQGDYIEKKVTQPTEITDTENLQGYYMQQVVGGANENYYNFRLDAGNEMNKLCIPPDLFYGVKQTGDVYYDYALNCTTPLQGIIPEHIFSHNLSGSIVYTFYNQDIIPRLYASFVKEDKTVNVYSHFPKNYTSNTYLNNVFSCNIVIPQNDSATINWVFIIHKDSIPKNTSSLQNAFNIHIGTTNGSVVINGQGKKDNNYINYIGEVKDNQVITGFDMNYFTQLYLDNLLYSQLNTIVYGNIFNSTFQLNNMKLVDTNNKVFYYDTDSQSVSQYLQFPSATANISSFFGVTNISLKSSQIPTTSQPYYKQVGINIVD